MPTSMPLAVGRTAEVFAWDEDRVLKLFRAEWGMVAAEHEAEIACAIYAAGAPSPRVYEVVAVDGRAGVIYERIAGPSLLEALLTRPWRLPMVARSLGATHAEMHRRGGGSPPVVPALRELLAGRIQSAASLSLAQRHAALRALDVLAAEAPAGEATLCHGDYHPANVLLSGRGPLVIDWENAALGDPLADVARTRLLLRVYHLHVAPGIPRIALRAAAVLLSALYLRHYCQLRASDLARLAAWELPVTAARLSEGIAEEGAFLLARVRQLCT